MNDVTIRFLDVYQYCTDKNIIKNSSQFSQLIGISPSLMNEISKGRTNVGVNAIQNTVNNIKDINPDWLLTGNGKMLKNETGVSKNETSIPRNSIPLVDVFAIGGFGGSDFVIEAKNIKDRYVLPIFNNTHIDFMIEVRGNSMEPRYSGGDIVACSIIKERNFIQWNKIHIVATKNQGIIIKRLQQGNKPNTLLAVSDNAAYGPFELPEDEITSIALVVGGVCIE